MRVEALPPANEIDHPEIRQAAEKHEAAQRQLKERQRELGRLEDSRDKAEELDAHAAADAINAGKPTPKRHHLADHMKKADELAHEVRVAKLVAQRARGDLQAALDTHQAEWAESLAVRAENLEQAWDESVAALIVLHGQRVALNARRGKLGAEVPTIGQVSLKPAQLVDSLSGDTLATAYPADPWDPTASQRRRAMVPAGDVLAALASLGVEEEITVVANTLGERFKAVIEHSQTVERGYHADEDREMERARAGREAARVAQSAPSRSGPGLYVNGRRVSVHIPGGED